MQVVLNDDKLIGLNVKMDIDEAEENTVFRDRDVVELSDKALELFRKSATETLRDRAMSLQEFDRRIAVIREEIATVWSGVLPEDEKYRLVSSKENEIALLQAGQFTFARAGFYKVA